ncbi:MAG TPA: sigma-E factor negative regulatory protein [Steroidobacteraceae bacterium]|jgi:sigma-E factor negative regulatory protein RseA|nr:sigma-E factor negative regulatory protein [Steroidobacteraceae bacterium]
MNEELDSQLSAMFDDELPSEECELLARRLSRDGELKSRWGRYAVIGAAIRAERGVRLNARVAGRVSARVRSEPELGAQAASARHARRWWRPLAGAAVAASVATVSILWLRAQGLAPEAPLAANALGAPASHVAAPSVALAPAILPSAADSYVVPPAPHGPVALVPTPELANYVVAHSMFSSPVARRNLLAAFMTGEAAGVGVVAAAAEPGDEPQRDAPGKAH